MEGLDLGKRFGCATMFIVAIIPLPIIGFAWAWSGAHCEPVPGCQRTTEWNTLLLLSGVLIFAAIGGFVVRKIVSGLTQHWNDAEFSLSFYLVASLIALAVSGIAVAIMHSLSLTSF